MAHQSQYPSLQEIQRLELKLEQLTTEQNEAWQNVLQMAAQLDETPLGVPTYAARYDLHKSAREKGRRMTAEVDKCSVALLHAKARYNESVGSAAATKLEPASSPPPIGLIRNEHGDGDDEMGSAISRSSEVNRLTGLLLMYIREGDSKTVIYEVLNQLGVAVQNAQ